MRSVLITLDSLNRHFLGCYGQARVDTPTIDSLAREGIVFENHFTASAPCMPARRELMTGHLELRHRWWGPLEPFDDPLPARLRRADTVSMLVTDHYHYFERGGENYHHEFTGYDFLRGHENDNWLTDPVQPEPINPLAHTAVPYDRALPEYTSPEKFPAARTFSSAKDWVRRNRERDSFFLYVDEFDPHEPFFAPREYLERYDDSGYSGPRLDWPRYGRWEGTEQETRHLRARYSAKVAFLDNLLAEFLAVLKENDLYDETTIILTTDHGHYLGDHGWVGKPGCDNYNTLFSIPLIVKPARELAEPERTGGRRVAALSSLPDLNATICEIHGAQTPYPTYGRSLLPLIRGESGSVRDYVLYGYYGAQLGYCDGDHTFLKTPRPENQPLYYYSNRFTSHPGPASDILREAFANAEERLVQPFVPGVDYPVTRIPLSRNIYHGTEGKSPDTAYSLGEDREQLRPIRDTDVLDNYRARMAQAMEAEGFPGPEFERLGLR